MPLYRGVGRRCSITASVQRAERAAGFRHGATAILKKPFNPAESRAAIARSSSIRP